MKRVAAVVALACLMASPTAKAAVCLVAASGISFGNYIPSSGGPTDSTGTVTVTCTAVSEQVQYSIALNAGQNAGGNLAGRRLQNGLSTISYQLYTDAARTTVWGDGTGGSSMLTDSYLCAPCVGQARIFNAYARMPGGQFTASPGLYVDTITVLVTFN